LGYRPGAKIGSGVENVLLDGTVGGVCAEESCSVVVSTISVGEFFGEFHLKVTGYFYGID